VHGARAERDEPRAAGLGIRTIASSAYAQHTLMRSAITSGKPMQSEALPDRTGVLWCAPHGWHTRAQNCGLAALAMSLDRFNQALAAVASFKDCQRVLTVGNLDGIETSTRRMNRTERLATIRVAYHGQNVICLDVYCRHDRHCKSAHPGDLSNPIGRPACIQGGVAGSGVRFRRSADRATRW